MTLDEVRRSLATGMRVDGDLAEALRAAGISFPAELRTDAEVEALQAAVAGALAPTVPAKPKKKDAEAA